MRQPLARALTRFAGTALAVCLAAHVAAHTVFAPDRAGRVVAAVLATDAGRDQVAMAVTAGVPSGQRTTARKAVRAELDSPKVREAIGDAVTPAAGSALPVGQVRSVLVTELKPQHPQVAAALAKAPIRDVPVPPQVSQRLEVNHQRTLAVRTAAAAAAAALAAAAVLVARARRRTCFALGRRAVAAAGSLLVLFVVVPFLLRQLAPSWGGPVAAGLRVAGADLVPAAVACVVAAGVLFGLGAVSSVLSPVASRREIPPAAREGLTRRQRPPRRTAVPVTASPTAPGTAGVAGPAGAAEAHGGLRPGARASDSQQTPVGAPPWAQ